MLVRASATAVVLALGVASASAQVKIGLMVSATGPTSAIGIPQKNTAALLPTRIGDASVEYIRLEDGGDTTKAVQNAKKLIGENNIDAQIGPSTTPNAFAILGEEKVEGTVGLILQRAIPSALKVANPGTEAFRNARRDAIEQECDVVGCQGVFNMSPTNHNGMDERARALVTIKGGRFRLLPE
jgi:hypothetical protein